MQSRFGTRLGSQQHCPATIEQIRHIGVGLVPALVWLVFARSLGNASVKGSRSGFVKNDNATFEATLQQISIRIVDLIQAVAIGDKLVEHQLAIAI